jgi:hypothetical protein
LQKGLDNGCQTSFQEAYDVAFQLKQQLKDDARVHQILHISLFRLNKHDDFLDEVYDFLQNQHVESLEKVLSQFLLAQIFLKKEMVDEAHAMLGEITVAYREETCPREIRGFCQGIEELFIKIKYDSLLTTPAT